MWLWLCGSDAKECAMKDRKKRVGVRVVKKESLSVGERGDSVMERMVTRNDCNTHAAIRWVSESGREGMVKSSAGMMGYKGSKRGTSDATGVVVRDAIDRALLVRGDGASNRVVVVLRGYGQGRSVILPTLLSTPLKVMSLSDASGVAHGGCRGKKFRRV